MILVAYGTRPEIIKLFPLIRQLKRQDLPFKTLFTGQHLDLYQDVKELMPKPDYQLNDICKFSNSLAKSYSQICTAAEKIISKSKFSLIVIQGDTTRHAQFQKLRFIIKSKLLM